MSRLTYSLIAIGLAGCAAADGWDDFTNNMATDLAPIISLFGEQATKQYLSESITWLDYFIFAMAPIGILTALVSAIRVCGSSSLRAFIGRAKEGAGSVEAELLSSTSHDVCEIYNSGGITRVFGRPKILEFVHNLDALNRDSAQMDSTAGISTFQEHIQTMPDDGEWEVLHSCRSNFPPEEYAPNLSHNVGIKRLDDNWFALVAVLGFVLQGGVLGLAWTATYFLRWEKEGAAPASYACPMAMAGTALLCIGVFCCAYLVGESTQERIYVRNHHTNSASRTATVIYWLQPTQVLGEQNFECFCYLDDGGAGSLSRYVSSWKKQKKTSSSYVWIVVSITAVGFVLQFVGFRGIHSAVSMAQLGAALIMSIARASLRTQRLDNQNNMLCNSQRIVKGYELDWLAVRMAEKELEVLNKTRPAKPIFWLFCGLSEPRRRMAKKRRRPSPEKTIGDVHDVNRIMVYRRRLAELTNLESFEFSSQILARHFTDEMIAVREIAGKLASSIESVANVVFMTTRSKAKVKPFWQDADILSWAVKCGLSFDYGDEKTQEVFIHLTKKRSADTNEWNLWSLDKKHDLEAILGLWVWSLVSKHTSTHPGELESRLPFNTQNAGLLRKRIICLDRDPHTMGFRHWFRDNRESDLPNVILAGNEYCHPSTIWIQNRAAKGPLIPFLKSLSHHGERQHSIGAEELDSSFHLFQLFSWYAGDACPLRPACSSETPTARQFWSVPTSCDVVSLCSMEVLGVFVKCMLDTLLDIGQVGVNSTTLCLESQLVSEIVDSIAKTELTSKDEALLCVLPQVIDEEYSAHRTPLWYAATIGHEGLLRNILQDTKIDACINIKDRDGERSPLWQAAANGHDNIARILLSHGADPAAMNIAGQSLLAKAAANGNTKVVKLLLELAEADPDTRHADGETALWHAASEGHDSVVRVLLEEGADRDIRGLDGTTPLSAALRNGHEIVVKIFRAQVEAEEVGFMDRIQLQGNDHMTAVFARAYSKAVGRTFLSTHVLSLGGHYETRPKPWKGPIRIAILDQGADTANVVCCGILGVPNTTNEHLIIDQKSWVDDSKDIGDTIHGTTVTSLVLRFGPKAEVYVAQVSRKSRVSIEDAGRIVRAIEHARDEWNVDMFVLPFGFRSVDQNIKRLLQDVRQKGKIIMAAAKAIGYNARRSYPANSPHVIGIHAVDGRGKHCEIAPAPVEGDHDFSTLGMGLERSLEGASEMVSGNSYAVCVAAGIAASFLEFARYKLTLDEEDQKWICSTDGMREMLLLMSTKIDGYNFLVPWELFSQRITTEEICEIILMTIRKRRREIGQH
ncbi:ankyrin repeat domain-containing protein 28 [Colletotrichum asianum]